MKRYLTLFLLFWVLTTAFAQVVGKNIVVTVTPDHQDWNYKVGEEASFQVRVLRSGTLVDQVEVDYEAGPEMYPTVVRKNVILKDGTMSWKGKLTHPGFYRLKVTAHVNGNQYAGLCTVGFSPERIQPATQCPANFDEFWSTALHNARKLDLDPHLSFLSDCSTKDVNVYEVSFINDRPNGRIFGILCVPTKEGRYPALLRVPGAGVRPYSGDIWTASQGAITLEIGIHGIPVTMPQPVYDELYKGGLDGYYDVNLENPDKNYYKRVVVGAVRAVDYIASLSQWNGQCIGVTGSSQGGFLSLAVAALDKRISFMAAVHDAMCDYESELNKVAGGWPHYFYWDPSPSKQRIDGARYYDGVNFARRISCLSWFSFGYNDEVVPPTSSYGVYNVVNAQKTLSVYPLTGHYWFQEQWDEWENWLLMQMKINH